MEKQQSTKPLIRFPEFKEPWEHLRLHELLSEAKKRNEDLKYGKDQVLSVSGELGIVNQIEHLGRSYAGVSVHQYHVVEVGDIVYTKSPLKANPFGIIKLNKGKAGIVSTLYAIYKVNQQTAYGPFIDYYFSLDANTNRYLRPLVRKGAKNTLQISNSEFISAEIFAPAIPEQKRIASFFTVLDKKIAELKQKKNLLEQYKKGIMQKLFSEELRFKDENGKEFPKWVKKKLREIIEYKNGGSFENLVCDDGKYFLITLNSLDIDGRIKPDHKRVDETDNSLKKGDLVMVLSDVAHGFFLGLTDIVPSDNYVLNQRMGALKPKVEINTFYLKTYINYNQKYFKLKGQGSSQKNLGKEDVLNFIVECPTIDEQNKISNFLTVIDEKISRTQNQMLQTQDYKKGLLQNMFI
jgi:type I restriction enzyme S subunit